MQFVTAALECIDEFILQNMKTLEDLAVQDF